MKLPKFAMPLARALGLGTVAVLAAQAEERPVDACVQCHLTIPGDWSCGGAARGGYYCDIGYSGGSFYCDVVGSCAS